MGNQKGEEHNRIRKRIIEILKKHPEGLTILEITSKVGASRATVTKYIYELRGAGLIRQRKVGVAKLCILEKRRCR